MTNGFEWYTEYVRISFRLCKNEMIVAVFLFMAGAYVGLFNIAGVDNVVAEIYRQLARTFADHHGVGLFFTIFFQNGKATLAIILTGVFFSIFPIVAALFNGIIIGCVFATLQDFSQFTPLQALVHSIPHGIFELPVFIFTVALGIQLGQWPFAEEKRAFIRTSVIRSLQAYFLFILPMLFIAGIIETCTIEFLRK